MALDRPADDGLWLREPYERLAVLEVTGVAERCGAGLADRWGAGVAERCGTGEAALSGASDADRWGAGVAERWGAGVAERCGAGEADRWGAGVAERCGTGSWSPCGVELTVPPWNVGGVAHQPYMPAPSRDVVAERTAPASSAATCKPLPFPPRVSLPFPPPASLHCFAGL